MDGNRVDEAEPVLPVPAAARPGLLRVLLAPAANLLRPARAARVLAAGRRRDFWLTYVAWFLLLSATAVALDLWGATYTYFPAPGTGPGGSRLTSTSPVVWKSRSVAEVWRGWHGVDWWSRAEGIPTLIIGLGTLAVAGLAWLQLPRVHRAGSVGKSYWRAFRALTAGLGLVMAVVVVLRTKSIVLKHLYGNQWGGLFTRPFWYEMLSGLLVIVGTCLALVWLGRAAGAVEVEPVDLLLPPRCEGCGYDLTHRPADGRCSECGMEVAASLTPGRLRPGSPWMRRPGQAASLVATISYVIFSPSRFYRALKLRTPGSTERGFAASNYAALACATFASVSGLLFVDLGRRALRAGGPWWWGLRTEMLLQLAAISLAFTLACWFGHRFVGAVAVSWWLARRELPDCRWAAKVIAYESAFLWVVAVCWGLLTVSLVFYQDWMRDLFGTSALPMIGLRLEPAAFFLVTAALGVVCLWRYAIAWRAIRWSNS